MALNRAHARRIGFVLVVLAGVWFETSPWGARTAAAVLEVQLLVLGHWRAPVPGDAAAAGATMTGAGATDAAVTDAAAMGAVTMGAGTAPERSELRPPTGSGAASRVRGAGTAGVGTAPEGPELRPLSPIVAMSLVVVGALVWCESRLLGWAIASSLVALVTLLAVSTMMMPRGVLVPTAGPGLAIVAGMLGRRALEAVIAFRDRRAHRVHSHPSGPARRSGRSG